MRREGREGGAVKIGGMERGGRRGGRAKKRQGRKNRRCGLKEQNDRGWEGRKPDQRGEGGA